MHSAPSDAPPLIGDTIRAEAARRRLRYEDMGDALGLSRTAVSSRCAGHTRWTLHELRTLADLFDLDLYALLDAASDGDEVLV